MIKALFFDLDGTLLNNKKEIPSSAITALNECRKKDIKLFISTARAPLLDKMLGLSEDILNLFDGGTYCNGAVIKTNKKIQYNYIDSSLTKSVLDIVSSYDNVHFALNLTDEYHCFNHYLPDNMLDPWGINRDKIVPITPEALSDNVKIIIYYNHLVDSCRTLPAGLYIKIKENFADKLNIYLQDKGQTIQISAAGISKCTSIKSVCSAYGFRQDEIAVFGDDINDMEMLGEFPHSIAMGNAEEKVKKVASCTTFSNENDGIYHAIKNILKLI